MRPIDTPTATVRWVGAGDVGELMTETFLEGVFRGRLPDPPYPQGGVLGSIVIDVEGRTAMFADVDVLRLEEIR